LYHEQIVDVSCSVRNWFRILHAVFSVIMFISSNAIQWTLRLFLWEKTDCLPRYGDWDFKKWTQNESSWGSSVDIAMGYRLDGPSSIPRSARFFSSPQCPDRLWGPPSLQRNGYWGLFLWGRGKAAVDIADHSPPSSAEVKKSGALPPFPHMSSWHSA
jgi:hypothetical protein